MNSAFVLKFMIKFEYIVLNHTDFSVLIRSTKIQKIF
jgi:hypothetical protein